MTAKGTSNVTLSDLGNALGEALGVKIDTASIVAQVKANTAKLDSCGLHDFVSCDAEPNIRTKYACTKCGGTVDVTRMAWYQKGLEHARKAVH